MRAHLAATLLLLAACEAAPERARPRDAAVDAPLDAAPLIDVSAPRDVVTSVERRVAWHSSSIALTPDGRRLFVVNPDVDTVSVIDPATRTLLREVALGDRPPAPDPATGRFEPRVDPRSLAYSPRTGLLYVTAERAGRVLAVDPEAGAVRWSVAVGSEPVTALLSPDERSLWVSVSRDGEVARVDLDRREVVERAPCGPRPWALGWSADASRLLVTRLTGPGLCVVDVAHPDRVTEAPVGPVAWRGDRRLAHGAARALRDVLVRPATGEAWVVHSLHTPRTAQPELDFESTVFPAVTVVDEGGATVATMSTDSRNVPGRDGAFADVVSGGHAVAFTPDGRWALVVDRHSEDLLAIDADLRVEAALLRPLPGHMHEGIALSPDGATAYLDARNSREVVVVRVGVDDGRPSLDLDGDPIATTARDLMPARLRRGQMLFHHADSAELPLSQNFWVACASCHVEGRSDGHVWRMAEGPRVTPSLAGGVRGTGFLNRTATRRTVQDFWRLIARIQGGRLSPDDPDHAAMLDALADYVDLGIPAPVAPRTDPARVERGRALFARSDVGCAGCHQGELTTDSGRGNASLDLAGPVLLHDVGTCNAGEHPDVPHRDDEGHPRAACEFDTPSLRGAAGPYMHDGSAATLADLLSRDLGGRHGHAGALTDEERRDLAEFVRSL